MAGILHFLDCSHGTTSSQKLFMPKRQMNGLEAPRNSLDIPAETFQNLCSKEECIPYSFQVKQSSSTGTPMKIWKDGETPNTDEAKQSVPSIIARLMGVDKFPSDIKPYASEGSKGPSSRTVLTKEPVIGKEFNRWNHEGNGKRQNPLNPRTSSKLLKSMFVEHPQEQRLQKFKKDFEAWEASKAWHSSRSSRHNRRGGFWNDHQILAQERLMKEKISRYAHTIQNEANNRSSEVAHNTSSRLKADAQLTDEFFEENPPKVSQENNVEVIQMQELSRNSGLDQSCLIEEQMRSLPTRIVLLKPGPERFGDTHESEAPSAGIIKENGGIKDSSDKAKEKLMLGIEGSTLIEAERPQSEIMVSYYDSKQVPLGKETYRVMYEEDEQEVTFDMDLLSEPATSQRSDAQIDEAGIETLLGEVKERLMLGMKTKKRPPNEVKGSCFDIPKNLNGSAKLIGKQARGGLIREMHLLWSESARTKRGNSQIDRSGFEPLGNQDTQKLLPERQMNVLRNEAAVDEPKEAKGGSRNSTSNESELSTVRDLISTGNKTIYPNNAQDEAESKGSPQPIQTDNHIRRKREMAEDDSAEQKKHRRSRFSLKGKVSSLRHSLSVGVKLFGKKTKSSKRGADEFGLTSTFVALPSVSRNSTEQENATDVPPIPVSVGSESQEEETSCKSTYHSSPLSTLDVPFTEEVPVPEALQEITSVSSQDVPSSEEAPARVLQKSSSVSTLDVPSSEVPGPEILQEIDLNLQEQSNDEQLKVGTTEPGVQPRSNDNEYDIELRETQIFLRDILQAAGFFENLDGILSMWESPQVCIRSWVFEEVEESYNDKRKQERTIKDSKGSNIIHKLLFDLLNEELLSKLASLATITTPKVITGSSLMNEACNTICKSIHEPSTGEDTINGLLAKDLDTTQWADMMRGDVKQISEDLDNMILDELLQEAVFDLYWGTGFTCELLADLTRLA